MSFKYLNGIWEGWYKFGYGYPEKYLSTRETFSMEIEFDGSGFEGVCHDIYTRNYFHSPATVRGKFESKLLTFVKTYPCLLGMDEFGDTYIDRDQPSQEIHYSGAHINRLLSFHHIIRGSWTIAEIFVHPGGTLENLPMGGRWYAQKRKKLI